MGRAFQSAWRVILSREATKGSLSIQGFTAVARKRSFRSLRSLRMTRPAPTDADWNRRHAVLILPAFDSLSGAIALETHGPLATLWVSIGLGLFYIALIWLNTLLGFFLTPLFIIPATWLMDRVQSRRR